MARKFLYLVAGVTVLVIAVLFGLAIFSNQLTRFAVVPTVEFEAQDELARNAYASPDMWHVRPGMKTADPTKFRPGPGDTPDASEVSDAAYADLDRGAAIFFVHPTSFADRSAWNAPLREPTADARTRQFLTGLASPFGAVGSVWAPRYRQATIGAFLTQSDDAAQAIELAYGDIEQAFEQFLSEVPETTPVVLAGHSQGALQLMTLLARRPELIEGRRIAAAYLIGWPISVAHDLPRLPIPPCSDASATGCIISYSSFAEPADPSLIMEAYSVSLGLDGEVRGDSAVLCSNPLTGGVGGSAPASANEGTLVPDEGLTEATLVPGLVPARCDNDGLLLIGNPPDLGPYVLPGNNYHVYDIPLFWANLRDDVGRRLDALIAS